MFEKFKNSEICFLDEILIELDSSQNSSDLSMDYLLKDINSWDSMGWIKIMNFLKQRYNVEISFQSASQIEDVGQFLNFLTENTDIL